MHAPYYRLSLLGVTFIGEKDPNTGKATICGVSRGFSSIKRNDSSLAKSPGGWFAGCVAGNIPIGHVEQ